MIKRAFCSSDKLSTSIAVSPESPKPSVSRPQNSLEEVEVTDKDNNTIKVNYGDNTISYDIPAEIGGTSFDEAGQYMIMFTCGVCKAKQSKFFTKSAYHRGVVLIRCDGCANVHLIADNLKWFGDENVNVESIMKEKGIDVKWANPGNETLRVVQEKAKDNRKRFDEKQKERMAREEEAER